MPHLCKLAFEQLNSSSTPAAFRIVDHLCYMFAKMDQYFQDSIRSDKRSSDKRYLVDGLRDLLMACLLLPETPCKALAIIQKFVDAKSIVKSWHIVEERAGSTGPEMANRLMCLMKDLREDTGTDGASDAFDAIIRHVVDKLNDIAL